MNPVSRMKYGYWEGGAGERLVKSPDIGDCLPVHIELEVEFVQASSGVMRPEASNGWGFSGQAFSISVRPDIPDI